MKRRMKIVIMLSVLAMLASLSAILCACKDEKPKLVSLTFRAYGAEDIVVKRVTGKSVTPPPVPEIENNIGHWEIDDFDDIWEDTVINAVYETEGLEFRLLEDFSYEVSGGKANKKVEQLFVPAEHEGRSVTRIADEGFSSEYKYYLDPWHIKTLHLPATIKEIGEKAFYDSPWLEQVLWESAECEGGIATIGKEAFKFCDVLQSFESDNVCKIDEEAFYSCSSLTHFNAENLTEIPDLAFNDCSLEEINLKNVTSIGRLAFSLVESLQRVEFPKKLKQLGNQAFSQCTALKEVVFEEGCELEYMGTGCFTQTAITKIKLPKGLKKLAFAAFESCKSLRAVILPEDTQLTAIEKAAFAFDRALESFTIPSSVESIGEEAFQRCVGISSITIPAGVKQMGENAFAEWTPEQTIYVAGRNQKPADWPENWCGDATVVWAKA